METLSQKSGAKRTYEAPTVSRVYVDPIVDMLTQCGVGDGKTDQSCGTISS